MRNQKTNLNTYIDYIITFGVVTDWLPSYIQNTYFSHIGLFQLSGTRLFIIPFLLLHIVKNSGNWLKFSTLFWIGLFLYVSFFAVLGHDNYAVSRIQTYGVSLLLFFFYKQPRDLDHIRKLLLFASTLAVLVPLGQTLAFFNVIQSVRAVDIGGTGQIDRYFGVTRTSSIPLFYSFTLSFLCGYICFLKTKNHIFFSFLVFSVLVFSTVLISGQRSAFIVAAICLAGSTYICLISSQYKFAFLVIIFLLLVLFVFIFYGFFENLFELQIQHLEHMFERTRFDDIDQAEGSFYARIIEFRFIMNHFFKHFDVFPMGLRNAFFIFHRVPHTFIGQLYTETGALFLIGFVYILLKVFFSFLSGYMRFRKTPFESVYLAVFLSGVGMLGSIAFMPLMTDRLVVFILGTMSYISSRNAREMKFSNLKLSQI